MRILSRYVLRQFLSPLVLSFLGFVAIFVVVDLVDRLSAFIDRGVDAATIAVYYAWHVPYVAVLVLPMAMLLASLFCIGELNRHRELAAMKSAGMSLYRIVLPLQVFALVVSGGAFLVADRVMPEANRRRANVERGEHSGRVRAVRSRVVLRDVGGAGVDCRTIPHGDARGAPGDAGPVRGHEACPEDSGRADGMGVGPLGAGRRRGPDLW